MRRFSVMIVCLCMVVVACGGGMAAHRPKGVIPVQGGTTIEGYGLAVDASFDPSLDSLVPGYHVVNVALVNSSMNLVFLSPEQDRWFIRTVAGKKRQAITDLRRANPRAWAHIPERARTLMTYPLVIPIGGRMVLDLFVPDDTPIDSLTEVIVTIDSLGATFAIAINQ